VSPEKERAKKARYRKANAEKVAISNARYVRENPEKISAKEAKRRAAKLLRTPQWADRAEIAKVYATAEMLTGVLGEEYHVDHVIPLQGERVSGLHVHTNLQVLPRPENLRKHNRFHA
jgi:hypothetical protein